MSNQTEVKTFPEIIRTNFTRLIEVTTCNDRFINALWSAKILSESERQQILFSKTPEEQSTCFYHILKLKDSTSIYKTIEILQIQNHAPIAVEILKSGLQEQDFKNPHRFALEAFKNSISNLCTTISFAAPKPPIKSFTGREKEIEAIHNLLTTTTSEEEETRIVCITGLGGVGKSELSRAYAKLHYDYYHGNIIWINAETSESIQESFYEIAGDLNIPIQSSNGRVRRFTGIVTDIYKYLSPVTSLFILDNVEEFDTICTLIPNLPPGTSSPWILMTSRTTNWQLVDTRIIHELPLNVPTLQESITFLSTQISLTSPDELELAEKLCVEYECLPLGLQVAAAYIRTDISRLGNSVSKEELLRKYLTQYKSKKSAERVLGDNRYQKMSDRYKNTIMNTWQLTLDKINTEDQDSFASLWLKILAYKRPFNIPLTLFQADAIKYGEVQECLELLQSKFNLYLKAGDEADEESIYQSLNLLANYSMIRIEDGLISFHRLVGQVLILQLKKDQQEKPLLSIILSPFKYLTPTEFDKRRLEICSIWQHCLQYDNLIQQFGPNLALRVNQDAMYSFDIVKSVQRFEEVFGVNHKNTLQLKLIGCTQYENKIYYNDLPNLLMVSEEVLGLKDALTIAFVYANVNKYIKASQFEAALVLPFTKYLAYNEKNSKIDNTSSNPYLVCFQEASNRVLCALSKSRNIVQLKNVLEKFNEFSNAQEGLVDLLHKSSIGWICFKGIITSLFLLDQDNDAMTKLNHAMEKFKEHKDSTSIVEIYAQIMSFLPESKMETLFNNLVAFWNISNPNASKEKKMADWWLLLRDEISKCTKEFDDLNKSFGDKVFIKEPFHKYVPHGFICSQNDFHKIDEGLTRFHAVSNFMHKIVVRDFNNGIQPKLSVTKEFMDNLQRFLSVNFEQNILLIGPFLQPCDPSSIAEYENGHFSLFLLVSLSNLSEIKSLEFGLQLLNHLIQHSSTWTKVNLIRHEFVKVLIQIFKQHISSNRILSLCYPLIITLTDNLNETNLIALEQDDLNMLLEQLEIVKDCPDQRKPIIWILSNLAENGQMKLYNNMTSTFRILLDLIINSRLNPNNGLEIETYFATCIILHHIADVIEYDAKYILETPSFEELNKIVNEIITIGWNQETMSKYFQEISFATLDSIFRLLFVKSLYATTNSLNICNLFAAWSLVGLLKSSPEKYAPMVLLHNNWDSRLHELRTQSQSCEPAKIVLEIMEEYLGNSE